MTELIPLLVLVGGLTIFWLVTHNWDLEGKW